ncbi:hypothetical protein JHK84_048181 [Glycine max]|nr:hypothetical protein JHK84_048181 [Glycine max]
MQGQYSQNVKTLLDSLMSVSAQKSFTATTPNALTRAYQCRGDLSNSECYNYINKIPNMLGHLCSDDDVVAAWVQLSKCYLRYKVVEFKVVPATQLLYKVCRARKVINGGGFKARRDVTFGMAENVAVEPDVADDNAEEEFIDVATLVVIPDHGHVALGLDNDKAGVVKFVCHGGAREEGEVGKTEGSEEGRGYTVVGDMEGALVGARTCKGILIEVERESESEK